MYDFKIAHELEWILFRCKLITFTQYEFDILYEAIEKYEMRRLFSE